MRCRKAILIAEGIVPSQTTNLKKDVTSGPDFIDLTLEDDVKDTLDAAHTGSNVSNSPTFLRKECTNDVAYISILLLKIHRRRVKREANDEIIDLTV